MPTPISTDELKALLLKVQHQHEVAKAAEKYEEEFDLHEVVRVLTGIFNYVMKEGSPQSCPEC